MAKKVFIKTYGCQMNELDSLRMQEQLEGQGYERTSNEEDADCILINTCSVREKPVHKVLSQLGKLKPLKEKKPELVVGVTGCVAQQEGKELFKKSPVVDLVAGPDHIGNVGELVKQKTAETENVLATKWQKLGTYSFPKLPEDYKAQGPQAYVTIQKGCDNFCSFCIVPFTRGREKSREADEVVEEVKVLASQGVSEVTLLGQNVNSYGVRLSTPTSFPELCKRVAAVEGIRRIRYTSPHPKDFSDADIENYASLKEMCPHLHYPLQSGSDEILEKMKRFYTLEEYMLKLEKVRKLCPDIGVGTDMIVGFPGETEKDFLKTLEAVKAIEFDYMYPFAYSQRPKTLAQKWEETVSEAEKKRRLNELIRVQEEITRRKNEAMLGKRVEVLIEGPSKNGESMMGRSGNFKIVHVPDMSLKAGDYVDLKITKTMGHSLLGEMILH